MPEQTSYLCVNDASDLKRKHRVIKRTCKFLKEKYPNVVHYDVDLSEPYHKLISTIGLQTAPSGFTTNQTLITDNLTNANTKSRMRMVTLYQIAGVVKGIVVGTGNKVEDYGVGFYTKYGDGGAEIAPIADLYKTEVWELGEYLKVDQRIVDADPTDGLWDDSRTDESQLGASYAELEEAMETGEASGVAVLNKFNTQNKHKMEPIPHLNWRKCNDKSCYDRCWQIVSYSCGSYGRNISLWI